MAVLKILASLFFGFDVLSLGALLAILWTMSTTSPDCEYMCLEIHGKRSCKCRANSLQDYLTWNFTEQYNTHNENLKKQYAANVLKDYTEKRLSVMKPNARLGGTKEEVKTEEDENQAATSLLPLRSWRFDGNDMFLHNGLQYRNGRIVVPFKGMYHIYGFLDMDVDETHDISKRDVSIHFSIYKSNILKIGTEEEEEELIGSFRPYEKKQSYYMDSYNTYISADVPLNPGDEVYIKICNKKFIKYPTKNWFGMHLL